MATAPSRLQTKVAGSPSFAWKAKATSLLVMVDKLARDGVKAKATTKDATRSLIDGIARRAGNTAQLKVLRDGLTLSRRNIKKAGG